MAYIVCHYCVCMHLVHSIPVPDLTCMAFLQADDEKVISGSYDLTLKVWDIKTGTCNHTLRWIDLVLCYTQIIRNQHCGVKPFSSPLSISINSLSSDP